KILLFFLPILIGYRIIYPLNPWYDAIIGSVIAFSLIAFIILVSNGGMGAGDMKLLAILGIVLGLKKVLLTFFIATLFGSIIGAILLYTRKVHRKQPIPFGPYLIIGSIISIFYGDNLISQY